MVAFMTSIVGLAPQTSADDKGYRVRWVGEQRLVVREGDLSGRIDLETLSKLPHLYAVGPVEGLKGEVTIFDGLPFITHVDNKNVAVDRSFRHKACFLVYAQVDRWQQVLVPESVKTASELEQFVWRAAFERLDVSKPFPFLVKGKPARVQFHVVNKTDDLPHNPEQHEKVKIRFELKDRSVEIVGFGSDKHEGVFTHHGSKSHMHVKTSDGTIGGHVDGLELKGGMTLFLPKLD